MALAAAYRLKKELEIKKILKTGRTVRGDFLFIKFLPNDTPTPRFALTVSLKISKKSAERNRIRRLLSEWVRLSVLPKARGYDTVIVVTKNGLSQTPEFKDDLLTAFHRAAII